MVTPDQFQVQAQAVAKAINTLGACKDAVTSDEPTVLSATTESSQITPEPDTAPQVDNEAALQQQRGKDDFEALMASLEILNMQANKLLQTVNHEATPTNPMAAQQQAEKEQIEQRAQQEKAEAEQAEHLRQEEQRKKEEEEEKRQRRKQQEEEEALAVKGKSTKAPYSGDAGEPNFAPKENKKKVEVHTQVTDEEVTRLYAQRLADIEAGGEEASWQQRNYMRADLLKQQQEAQNPTPADEKKRAEFLKDKKAQEKADREQQGYAEVDLQQTALKGQRGAKMNQQLEKSSREMSKLSRNALKEDDPWAAFFARLNFMFGMSKMVAVGAQAAYDKNQMRKEDERARQLQENEEAAEKERLKEQQIEGAKVKAQDDEATTKAVEQQVKASNEQEQARDSRKHDKETKAAQADQQNDTTAAIEREQQAIAQQQAVEAAKKQEEEQKQEEKEHNKESRKERDSERDAQLQTKFRSTSSDDLKKEADTSQDAKDELDRRSDVHEKRDQFREDVAKAQEQMEEEGFGIDFLFEEETEPQPESVVTAPEIDEIVTGEVDETPRTEADDKEDELDRQRELEAEPLAVQRPAALAPKPTPKPQAAPIKLDAGNVIERFKDLTQQITGNPQCAITTPDPHQLDPLAQAGGTAAPVTMQQQTTEAKADSSSSAKADMGRDIANARTSNR